MLFLYNSTIFGYEDFKEVKLANGSDIRIFVFGCNIFDFIKPKHIALPIWPPPMKVIVNGDFVIFFELKELKEGYILEDRVRINDSWG